MINSLFSRAWILSRFKLSHKHVQAVLVVCPSRLPLCCSLIQDSLLEIMNCFPDSRAMAAKAQWVKNCVEPKASFHGQQWSSKHCTIVSYLYLIFPCLMLEFPCLIVKFPFFLVVSPAFLSGWTSLAVAFRLISSSRTFRRSLVTACCKSPWHFGTSRVERLKKSKVGSWPPVMSVGL